MPQVRIYGLKDSLTAIKQPLSNLIYEVLRSTLNISSEKRFHLFFPMEDAVFLVGPGRSPKYTLIEITLFEGRSVEDKRHCIESLYSRAAVQLGIASFDLEIILIEIPKENWGIAGKVWQ